MEAPTAANAGQQSLLKSSDAANGGDELVINVAVDPEPSNVGAGFLRAASAM